MKWMIASDIHGSALYCGELLRRFDREEAQRLLLLGDLLYHGPRNELPEGYAPKEVISMLNARKDRILCVRGNCEAEVDQMVLEFPIMADYAWIPLGERLLYVTHGHLFNRDKLPPLRPGDIFLQGHTHIPLLEEIRGITVMNPGSVSIPKNGSARGYMTMEEGRFLWKDLQGQAQMEYRL